MGLYVHFLLNRGTTEVSYPFNDTISFHLYNMCQTYDEIFNLKHEI